MKIADSLNNWLMILLEVVEILTVWQDVDICCVAINTKKIPFEMK